MKLRWLGVVALALVGVVAVVLAIFGPTLGSSGATQYITSRASVTDVVDDVVASGTLAAQTTYGLNFGSAPRIVSAGDSGGGGGTDSWLVESIAAQIGQHVKAGDVLAIADDTDAQAALELANANLAVAQARYDTDAAGTTAADLESLQIALDQAQANLTSAQKSRDDTIRQNNIRLSQQKAAVRQAKRTGNQTAINQAQDALDLLEAQISSQNRQAREQVASARLALDSAQNNYDNQTAPVTDSELASDRAALLQAQQAASDAQAKVDAATLTANADGVVVAVNVVAGALAPSTDAVQLRTTAMQVSAEVAESDLPSLAIGQPATVTVSATADQLSGTVKAIAPQASAASGSSVVSYAVTIEIDDVPDSVRPGMSAQVAVTVASANNVLAVPAIALNGSSGNYSVRVLDSNGGVSARPVEVGLITASLAEIKGGLAEGDSVVTGTTSSLNSAANSGNGFPGGGLQGGGRFPAGGGTVVTNP